MISIWTYKYFIALFSQSIYSNRHIDWIGLNSWLVEPLSQDLRYNTPFYYFIAKVLLKFKTINVSQQDAGIKRLLIICGTTFANVINHDLPLQSFCVTNHQLFRSVNIMMIYVQIILIYTWSEYFLELLGSIFRGFKVL